MASTDPTAIIILSEIVFAETVIIIGVAVFFLIKKRKLLKLFKSKIDNFDNNLVDRKSSLKSTYSALPHLDESGLLPIIDGLVKNESQFYKLTLDAFSKNDLTFIDNLDEQLFTLVEPYSQFIPKETLKTDETEEEESIIPDVDSAIDELLSDDTDEEEGDPALDLSESIDTDKSDDEMAEIPEELLSGTASSDASSEAENTSEIANNAKEKPTDP